MGRISVQDDDNVEVAGVFSCQMKGKKMLQRCTWIHKHKLLVPPPRCTSVGRTHQEHELLQWSKKVTLLHNHWAANKQTTHHKD